MNTVIAITSGVAVAVLAAGVIGVWKLYGQVQAMSAKLDAIVDRIKRHEQQTDERFERIERALWPPAQRNG